MSPFQKKKKKPSNVSPQCSQNKLPSKQKSTLVRPGISLDNSNLVGHIQGVIIRCQPDISLLGAVGPATEKSKFRRNDLL